MRLINIFNKNRTTYLFCRDKEGNQTIKEDSNFFPYFYEVHDEGKFQSFDGKRLKKIFASTWKDLLKLRSMEAYEGDIQFAKRYMIDKINEIEKTTIKYSMLDIEVLTDVIPDPKKAKYPISCISFSNSFTKEVKTFYLGDYATEHEMINDFILEFTKENFDLMIGWNIDEFDYKYMYNRIPDIAKLLSPIKQERWGREGIRRPAGLSIIDLMNWDKKVTLNKRKEYSLDAVLTEELGRGKEFKDVDFSVLNPTIKARNKADVEDMMKLEDKKQYIGYFDDIRRLAKVEWEDLIWNSRIIDNLLLMEGREQKLVLPMKPDEARGTLTEKESYEGAYRDIYKKGFLSNVTKYDLSSCYPQMIIDFNLDPTNVVEEIGEGVSVIETKSGDENTLPEYTYFKQKPGALLPTVVKKLIDLKGIIGKEKNNTSVDSPEYKDISKRYSAIKSIANSAYGSYAMRFFRLFNRKIASATTFLVRDLLHYVKDKIESRGYPVVYADTDSIFLETKENLTEELNKLVLQWGRKKYNKNNISAEFGYEGMFEQVILIARCRYKGWIRTPKGELKVETCGVESKRKDSTVFMKGFQIELFEKIRLQESKDSIVAWIRQQMEEIKNEPLMDVSFPCKLGREPDKYVNTPIFLRALNNTKNYDKKVGQRFYYVPMLGKDETKKQMVKAFDDKKNDHIDRNEMDWAAIIEKNIIKKLVTLFEAMNWDLVELGFVKPKKKRRKVKDETCD